MFLLEELRKFKKSTLLIKGLCHSELIHEYWNIQDIIDLEMFGAGPRRRYRYDFLQNYNQLRHE